MTKPHSLQDMDDLIVHVQEHTPVLTVLFQAKARISQYALGGNCAKEHQVKRSPLSAILWLIYLC